MTSKDDAARDSAPPEVIGCEIGSVVRTGALVYLGLRPASGATVVHSCSPAQAREFGRALVAQADALDGGTQ